MIFVSTVSLHLQSALIPLPLVQDSFNADIVVERTAPPPVVPATTASMDSGWTNTGYGWYERGYHANWPATGLPLAGAVISSDLAADRQYQMAPDYSKDNVVLLDATVPNGELQVVTPASYAVLSLLLSGMHSGGRGTLVCTVFHQDATSELGTVTCFDWMRTGYSAYTTEGRIDVANFTFSHVNGGLPKLFTAEITLTNRSSPVTRIEIEQTGGVRTAIFALSGATVEGAAFTPIPIRGFNADVIVEAGAVRTGWLAGVTTGSMETGRNNTLRTWYEQGYVPGSSVSGLPPAGVSFTNETWPGYAFSLAHSYETNNALLLDNDGRSASLALAAPAAVRALSFLTASANGPTTNQCIAQHLDGSSETNLFFVAPDWMGQGDRCVLAVGGRVNLNNRIVDHPTADRPGLFAVDVPLTNTLSPVTSLVVTLLNPAAGKLTAVMAVSGQPSEELPEAPMLTIRRGPEGTLILESTSAGTLESTTEISGSGASWTDEGPIDGSRTVTTSPTSRFWRVRR